MHILNSLFLNSEWLIKMLEKSSQTPHGRLLSLFDILEDWLDAPNVAPTIREQIAGQFTSPKPAKILQDYLTLEAAKAGAAMRLQAGVASAALAQNTQKFYKII